MKLDYKVFLGVLMIGGGVLALLQAQGYYRELAPEVWVAIFAVICIAALVGYALSGFREWAWLFPAGVAGGLAVVVALAIMGINQAWMASPLFLGLVIPFAAAFLADRSRNWWALIPGGIMAYLAVMMLFADGDRAEIIGPLTLLAIAAPFYVVYFRSGERWWAIIPAGIMTVIAAVATLAISGFINSETQGGWVGAVMMGGFAAVFAVVGWRERQTWARVVTLVFLGIAAATVLFASQSQVVGAVGIIVLGAYLLVSSRRAQAKV